MASFAAVVEDVRPNYASITVDWPLASPLAMAADPRSGWHHRDFYLAKAHVGATALDEVAAAASDLVVERTEAGLHVWSSPEFDGTGAAAEGAGATFARAIARGAKR